MKPTRHPAAVIVNSVAALVIAFTLAACDSGEQRQAKYFERAQALYDSENYDKAQLEVKNVLQINPNHAPARYLWALLLERQQNWREMFGNLQMAVDTDPSFVGARIKLGQLYYRSAAYDQALEQADAVLALDPDSADGHTLRGSVLFRQGDNEGALAEAQLAMAQQPGHIGAISIITEVYRTTDPERALAVIGDGIAQQTENATLKLLKISVLEEQGDADGVIEVYKELIAAYPENLFFHYRLVKFYEEQQRIDEAETLLRDIVKTKPENLQLKLWLAEFLANQRNLALAEAAVKEFIANQPDIYQLRFALAKIHTAQGNYPEAEAVYTDVIARDEAGEDSQYARNQLVKLYLARGEQAKATALLDEIFVIEKENTEAMITAARLKLATNETDAAIANLRTVVKNEPTSTEALLLLARAHEAAGSQDLAIDNYRNVLALAPANEMAVLNLARLQLARGEYEPADALLTNYLNAKPLDAEASRLLVESYSKQDRLDDALAIATALEQNPDSTALALYLQGRVYLAQKNYPAAESKLAATLEAEPAAIEALAYLVGAYRAQGKDEEAYAYLTQHVAQYPEHAHALEQLGTLESIRGNTDKAIEHYKAALAVAPGRVSTTVLLAQVLVNAKRPEEAVALNQQAAETAPKNVQLKFLTAGVYEGMGDYAAAKEYYEAALAIDPKSTLAANNLAMLLVDRMPSEENNQRALELALPFAESKEAVLLDTLGWVYYRMGDYGKALPYLERAVGMQGSAYIYQLHLGMAAYRAGDTGKARSAMEAALEGNPDIVSDPEVGEVLGQLGLEKI